MLDSSEVFIDEQTVQHLTEIFFAGVSARNAGYSWGSNPYNPETETRRYEAWMNGWSSVDNVVQL